MAEFRDRSSEEVIVERQFGDAALRFLYHSRLGQLLLPVATLPLVSELAALTRRLPRSARAIPSFVAEHQVVMDDFVEPSGGWRSFADFFVRDWRAGARPIAQGAGLLLSPADAKLLVVPLADGDLVVKGVRYSLAGFLQDAGLAEDFADGTAFVFRLTVDDAHRYLHAVSGRRRLRRRIAGRLHTVGPLGEGRAVLVANRREYDVVESESFGLVVQAEVGALLVGRIRNHDCGDCRAGTPKGRFELGGSSIVLLFGTGAIEVDQDLLDWSRRGVETRVRAGERLGRGLR